MTTSKAKRGPKKQGVAGVKVLGICSRQSARSLLHWRIFGWRGVNLPGTR